MPIVSGSMTAILNFQQLIGTGFLAGQNLPITRRLSVSLGTGVGADNIDLCHALPYVFTGTTPQTIDLRNLVDVEGNAGAVNFARVKYLAVLPYVQTDGVILIVAASASNGCTNLISTGGLPIRAATLSNPFGAFLFTGSPSLTGAVVDSSHYGITFTPSASCNADILIFGNAE